MANELTVNCSLEYESEDGPTFPVEPAEAVKITLATDKPLFTIQTVSTSEEAIELGDISSRAICLLENLDTTNYIEIKVGTGGAIFAKLFPKGSAAGINFCLLSLGSGAQSPFAIANSGDCKMAISVFAL